MKIVHIVEPFAAGLVTFIKTLVENHPDEEIVIIHGERKNVTPAEEIKKQFHAKVKFFRWENSSREISFKQDFKAAVSLYKILSKHKDADIVHLHSSKAGFIGRLVCFLLGIKNVIYTPNGISFINDDLSAFKSFLYSSLERFGNLFPAKVVSSSKSEQKALLKKKIKSKLIYNGTHIEAKTNKYFKHNNKFKVATCGRIAPQKAPNMFNAIASQFSQSSEIEFVWIGDGIEREKLSSSNIRVTGWLDKEGVQEELRNTNLYLSTARWEGLPFAVLEAMNLALPLLLSRSVGNDDLVIEGVNGYQFKEFETAVNYINKLVDNPISLHYMGLNSKEICSKKYRIEKSAAEYKNLYNKIAFNLWISNSNAEKLNLHKENINVEDYKIIHTNK